MRSVQENVSKLGNICFRSRFTVILSTAERCKAIAKADMVCNTI